MIKTQCLQQILIDVSRDLKTKKVSYKNISILIK